MATSFHTDIDKEAIQQFYSQNEGAQAVLDHFANRERNQRITTVRRLIVNVSQDSASLSRGDIVQVLKRLDELGCGSFIAGRKGYESRFEWRVASKAVGQVAAGEDAELDENMSSSSDSDQDDVSDELLEHVFHLRPDLLISFNLPADLTQTEAKRLSEFIQTLPFTLEYPYGGLEPEDFSDWEESLNHASTSTR